MSASPTLRRAFAARLAAIVALVAGASLAPVPAQAAVNAPTIAGSGSELMCGSDLVKGGVTATASNGDAWAAVDGNEWSRWDSGVTEEPSGSGNWVGRDGEWISVDLGSERAICGVKPYWEAAYAADYDVEASLDGVDWTLLAQVRGVGSAGAELTRFSAVNARYLRLTAVTRGTQYGVSIWDMEILEPRLVDRPTTSLLGDRVVVLDPTMDSADIQAILDDTFTSQETNQFGDDRWQFVFLPGTYTVDARVGFYTSLAGAGLDPTDVSIVGGDWVDADWFDMNGTQNFWRSAENLSWTPTGGTGRWAVSQASSFRRMHVDGTLALDTGRYGWISGSFIADTEVTGYVTSYAEQQSYTRDSSVDAWAGGIWNTVSSGLKGDYATGTGPGDTRTTLAAASAAWPTPPVTALPTTGPIAEKPYLHLTGADIEAATDWAVRVPDVRDGTAGTTWAFGSTPGTDIPLTDFFIAQEGATATQINAALAAGRHVLFAPGIHELDRTLEVSQPGTVLLGLGLATLVPTGGGSAIHVADVDGVRIAGLLLDAAPTGSPSLLTVGDADAHTDHSADPIVLSDIYLRVGGAGAGTVDDALVIAANDTIVDHVWAWRADHGTGVGWTVNTAEHGLVVDGDDVSIYGLFVEHFQGYNVLWNGDGGRTVFFQNELPYDVPDQETWQNGNRRGYAAYKVATDVTTHEAWGLGSYSNFTEDTEEDEITVDNAFEVPQVAGVAMHRMLTVSLGGEGIFEHVINGVGDRQFSSDTVPTYLEAYPTGPDDPIFTPVDPAPEAPTPASAPAAPASISAPSLDPHSAPVPAGGRIAVSGDGFTPGEDVVVTIDSKPAILARVVAGPDGAFHADVPVPDDLSTGEHVLTATGVLSGRTASLTIQVQGLLAATGAGEFAATTAAALALLAAGLGLLAARRRLGR